MTLADLKAALDGREDNEAVMIDGHAVTNFDNVPPESGEPGYLDLTGQ